ncbi:MAG: transketolase [Clostridia bacterium]
MSLETAERLRLARFAEQIRVTTMRTVAAYGEGHIGGALSIADVLAVLYGRAMRVNPAAPKDPDRDKLVLSKGHCGPALYATLALKGYFPLEELSSINRLGTRLPSHCDMNRTPGIDMSTGSLGQGASTAAGIALADKMKGRDAKTYLILGDGECDEGQVWEMVLFAAQQRLGNLIAFIDWNHQQLDGYTKDVCRIDDFESILHAYGWRAVTVDGHDVEAISSAISHSQVDTGVPAAIVLNTVKGKGWAEAETRVPCHYMTISSAQLRAYEAVFAQRIASIEAQIAQIPGKAGTL